MAIKYTEYEHKIAAASKAWRFYEWVCSNEFAQGLKDRHVVIASGAYTGRPSIPLQKQKDRAIKEYRDELENLRGYELQKHLKHKPEDEVKDFVEAQGNDKKGRKRGGRALALQKYIRRIERQIVETQEADDSAFMPQLGPGRPKMSRKEKVNHFGQLIDKAHSELLKIYDDMEDKDRIWHEMHDLKSDRRQMRLALKDPENPQSKRIWEKYDDPARIVEALKEANAKISQKEAQMKMIEVGMTVPHDSSEQDLNSPQKLEEYRRTLDNMIKEQAKIKILEQKAAELGIDFEKLKRLM